MSVAIVAFTKYFAVVATDSKIVGLNLEQPKRFRKLYNLNDHIVAYGVGCAGLCIDFFGVLERIKQDYGPSVYTLRFENAVELLREWRIAAIKQYIVNSPEIDERSAVIGVCGVHNNTGSALTTLVSSGTKWESELCSPNSPNELRFRIFPPSDMEQEVCDNIFKSHIPYTAQFSVPRQMIDVCTKTIYSISRQSQFVDDHIQYWVYDLMSGRCQTRLFDYPPL